MKYSFTSVLLGENRYQTLLVLGTAIVLLSVAYGIVKAFEVGGLGLHGVVLLGGTMLILSGASAYYNNGVVPSVLVGVSPFAGYRLWYYFDYGCFPCPEGATEIIPAVVLQSAFVAPLPLIGYLGGRFLQRRFVGEL